MSVQDLGASSVSVSRGRAVWDDLNRSLTAAFCGYCCGLHGSGRVSDGFRVLLAVMVKKCDYNCLFSKGVFYE